MELRRKGVDLNKLSFTGHSLGGGLASIAALDTGLSAITFNAMAISPAQRWCFGWDLGKIHNSNITSYYIPGEALTNLYNNVINKGAGEPDQHVWPGKRIELKPPPDIKLKPHDSVGAVELHGMTSILKGLDLPSDDEPPIKD